jgi:hypothetical protein
VGTSVRSQREAHRGVILLQVEPHMSLKGNRLTSARHTVVM